MKVKKVSAVGVNQEQFNAWVSSIEGFESQYHHDITVNSYFGFPVGPILEAETRLSSPNIPSIAYFSMEYGLAPSIYNSFQLKRPMSEKNQFFVHEVFSNYWLCDYLFKIKIDKMLDIPIYGGGLGVLAGDVIKSSADLGYPFVGIGVLWNKGYFKQNFWYKHGQVPEELQWDPWTYPGLIPLKHVITINTKEGPLAIRLWKYYVYSFDQKNACPLILLDSNLEQNPEHFRKLTDQLYRSDHAWWKIFQRIILGIGGMKALDVLGYQIHRYHLNEGHAAFALLEKYVGLNDKREMEAWKERFIFTCHTPVAAGHDRFHIKDVEKILDHEYIAAAQTFDQEGASSHQVNLTLMSLNSCKRVNAVAEKHGEVMRLQFPDHAPKVQAITNGVHLHTWLSRSFQDLFDQYQETFGDWRYHPERLQKIMELVDHESFRRDIVLAHQKNKNHLMRVLKNWRLKGETFTICWARRMAGYKRPALIFQNIERIVQMAHKIGPIQILIAGKAHPNDNIGAAHIDEILDHINQMNEHHKVVKVLILENYDTFFGKLLTNSVDVWLNNPLPPFEASGTSGMKAILNGVLQLSTLDGWVVEAINDDIGWIFGYQHSGSDLGQESELRLEEDSRALYDHLEKILQLYYHTYQDGKINLRSAWIDKMIHCVKCAAFFNTNRMVKQYHDRLWKV
jgi:starch phosphorylase